MSAIIGIRCDECGREITRPYFAKRHIDMLSEEAVKDNWLIQDDGDDLCPFCRPPQGQRASGGSV